MRSDSAGENSFAAGLQERSIGFQTVARKKLAVSAAIAAANTDPGRWTPAVNQDGTPQQATDSRRIAEVCEVTDLVDLDDWPEDTRLIIRREPLHTGAQQTLLSHLEYRFWGHYTDQDGDPAQLDQQMRAHAHCEDHIERLKDSRTAAVSLHQLHSQPSLAAGGLLGRRPGPMVSAPLPHRRTSRRQTETAPLDLWHTPARIVRTARRDIIRIIDGWPNTAHILGVSRTLAGFT